MLVQSHHKLDTKLIDASVYPGAICEDAHVVGKIVQLEYDSTHKEFSVMGAEYSTYDSIDKVKEFYHRELPHWIISKSRHGRVQMEYTEDGYKRIVAIHEQDGRTRIGLASVGEPASN
jgi:hypothetical protein